MLYPHTHFLTSPQNTLWILIRSTSARCFIHTHTFLLHPQNIGSGYSFETPLQGVLSTHIFSYFSTKHMLWILIRNTSERCFIHTYFSYFSKKHILWTLIRNTSPRCFIHTYTFLTSPKNICCGYSLEAPQRGALSTHILFLLLQKTYVVNIHKKHLRKVLYPHIYFLTSPPNIDCGYSLEAPQQGSLSTHIFLLLHKT